MYLSLRNAALVAAAPILGLAASFTSGVLTASAQIPNPPASFYGSVASSTEIPDGTKVEAYIGDVECTDGTGRTGFTGVGDARVAVYVVNVFGSDYREGCGTPGAEVRIKIGDEFAPQTGVWQSGRPSAVNLTFDDLPTVVLPTNTPNPPTNTPSAEEETATAVSGQTQESTGEAGTPTNTPQGGLESSTPGVEASAGGGDDEGGFPVWGIVVIGLAVLGAAGGGVGYLISRNNREAGLEEF